MTPSLVGCAQIQSGPCRITQVSQHKTVSRASGNGSPTRRGTTSWSPRPRSGWALTSKTSASSCTGVCLRVLRATIKKLGAPGGTAKPPPASCFIREKSAIEWRGGCQRIAKAEAEEMTRTVREPTAATTTANPTATQQPTPPAKPNPATEQPVSPA